MNERIKELAEEAEKLKRDEVSYRERLHNRYCTGDMEEEIFREKFAELIVRECIRIGQETSKEIFKMSKKEGDIFEYESHGAEQVVDNIKEHFGVEE